MGMNSIAQFLRLEYAECKIFYIFQLSKQKIRHTKFNSVFVAT